MSKEVEIDKLEKLIDRCNECKFATCENCEINWTEIQAIKGLLDLYKKLKEIEKTHKEENGKLRVELEQEKEKNMQLNQEVLMYKNAVPNQYNFFDYSNYISKDKIKEKIEFYKEKCVSDSYNKGFHNTRVNVLEELLEEK